MANARLGNNESGVFGKCSSEGPAIAPEPSLDHVRLRLALFLPLARADLVADHTVAMGSPFRVKIDSQIATCVAVPFNAMRP